MPTAQELDTYLERLSSEVDAWTRTFFDRSKPSSDRFARLISYPLGWVDASLRPLDRPAVAGKRLRSTLCLLCCEAVGGDPQIAVAGAAAVELVHNFSLVHDDIQDNSALRRGRPSVWALWNTAQAINVGDSLFALAQLALLQTSSVPPDLLAEAARRLNKTCLRLVEGQFLDLELQAARSASLETYRPMVLGKTAALLEYAAWLGARVGGADAERSERFGRFGQQIGVAFQTQDDVLGIWGDPAATGKSTETDMRSHKTTFPVVLLMELDGPAPERFRRLFQKPGEMANEDVSEAVQILDETGIHELANGKVAREYDVAEQALFEALPGAGDSVLWALVQWLRHRTG
jgi:geranylgeranyl diphosphate synthase, type I